MVAIGTALRPCVFVGLAALSPRGGFPYNAPAMGRVATPAPAM